MKSVRQKFLFVLVLLFLNSSITSAQNVQSLIKKSKIGFKVMLNLADMRVNPTHQIDTKILGGVGAFATINLKENFSFQPEFYYL